MEGAAWSGRWGVGERPGPEGDVEFVVDDALALMEVLDVIRAVDHCPHTRSLGRKQRQGAQTSG